MFKFYRHDDIRQWVLRPSSDGFCILGLCVHGYGGWLRIGKFGIVWIHRQKRKHTPFSERYGHAKFIDVGPMRFKLAAANL